VEDQPEMFSALTTPVKQGRLEKSNIRNQNKRTIYNIYNFFKDISEQPEHLNNTSLHKIQDITVKACGVHHSTVHKICNETSISSSDNKIYAYPRKTYKRKDSDTDMNDFDKEVLCRTVYEHYDEEYPTATKLRKIMEENIGFSGPWSSILRILRKVCFRYRQCNNGRKFLMEKRDLWQHKWNFLER
jgi:hypothetical protein